jgi:hypothetical protein
MIPTKRYIVWSDSGGDGWSWTEFDTLEQVYAYLVNGGSYSSRIVVTENLDLRLVVNE